MRRMRLTTRLYSTPRRMGWSVPRRICIDWEVAVVKQLSVVMRAARRTLGSHAPSLKQQCDHLEITLPRGWDWRCHKPDPPSSLVNGLQQVESKSSVFINKNDTLPQ
jgi:hypothetical protein